MSFREFLNEKRDVVFKSPKGFFDDESMVDDFASELSGAGFEWDEDFTVDGDVIKFSTAPSSSVIDILKSLRFKKR